MRKRWLSMALAAVLAASALTGCGGGGSTTATTAAGESTTAAGTEADAPAGSDAGGESEAQAPEGADRGNSVVYAIDAEPETLDPGMCNYNKSSAILLNLFNGLYRFSDDGSNVEPAMAESHTVSDDGLVYTFTLRDGLKWSDGSALTAADFEYSWKRELNADLASPAAWNLFDILNAEEYNNGECSADEVGIKALDDKTLEVTLKNPTAYFISLTASANWSPVKKDVVEGSDSWVKSADTYVCNGPFMLQEIKPQAGYTLVKNPEYFDAANVNLDSVEIAIIEQAEAALSAYNAGDIDVMIGSSVGTQAMAQYEGSEELSAHDLIGTSYFDFNCSKDYMSAEVRKALSMAIVRNTVNDVAVPSKPKSAFAFVPYGIPYGDETTEFRDKVGAELIKEDVEAAKQLLADAGYPDGEGLPTLQFIITNTQENKDKAQVMQAMWKESLGVECEIVTFESKVYWDEHGAGNFDIAFDGWTGDYLDPNSVLNIFNKGRMEKECRWQSDAALKYDDLLNQAAASADNNERMEIFTECEQILMDEMPVLPLYYRNTMVLSKPHVKGFTVDFGAHPLFRCVSVE